MKPRTLLTALMTATLFAAQLSLPSPAQNNAPPAARGVVTIGESSQYSTATNKPQRFIDYVEIKAEDATLPLTLNILNGNNISPGFNWVRVSLSGKTLFTQNNVLNKKEIPFSVTGLLSAGTSQIVVEAGGIPGSTMSWKLLAAQVAPTLQSGKPDKAGLGDTITLTGTHFGTKPSTNTVTFGGIKAQIKSVSGDTSLEVVVPANAAVGDNKVTVTTGGAASNAIVITIVAVPELDGLSLTSGPPGQDLTISGKNFSKKASENTVTIAGASAEITEASPTSLTVIIPEVYNPQYAVPVTVEVNGVKAKNSINFDIYNRVY